MCPCADCRDTACRVRRFMSRKTSVENIPPECFQNHSTASGTQGGAVLFAPPSKSCRFSHPPSPRARSMAQGISLSADSDSEGYSPSENTSPTVLSWISLTSPTNSNLFVPARYDLLYANKKGHGAPYPSQHSLNFSQSIARSVTKSNPLTVPSA